MIIFFLLKKNIRGVEIKDLKFFWRIWLIRMGIRCYEGMFLVRIEYN